MLAILPVFCFISIFLVLRKFQVLGWRGSFLLSAVLWGFLLTAITEFLSLLRWLDFWSLIAAWGIVLLLLLLTLAFSSRKKFSLRQNLHLISISRFELALLVCVFLIVVTIGVIAWVAPPNTSDSMTYHMSRVMHWIQNKSVAFYPTHILRQLHMNPWSEFAILHFQILNGGDGFANFIQWFSMVGSIVGVSLLAKELNASIRGQIFAAVVCVTIPMGVLQGSSTQTDYVVSFWLVCFVYFAIRLRKEANLLYALGTGAALGLGILTKATAYIFAFPFLAWLVLSTIKFRLSNKMLFIALALIITFVTNLGHYARNYDLFGNPLGPGQEGPDFIYTNETFSVSAVTSNLIRNVGLHLGTPINRLNAALVNTIIFLHKLIGIPPNDVRTTWGGKEFSIRFSYHENSAGNLVHLFLITVAFILYVFQRSREREAGFYVFSLLLAFLLFSVFLKWQLWNSRLHLPLFILCAPFIGLIISSTRDNKITNLCMALLIVVALPWVFLNSTRPILGKNSIFTTSRIEQYFINSRSLMRPYFESAQILSHLHCSDIGLITGMSGFEYPLWILLRENTSEIVRIEHVNVTNISQGLYSGNHLNKSNKCAIFTLKSNPKNTVSIGNSVYSREWSSGRVNLYRRTSIP